MRSGKEADERAASWVVRLDAGPLRDEEQRELDAWLAADERNRGAFVRAQARWLDLDRYAALSSGAAESPADENPRIDRRSLIAAGIAGLAVAAGAGWMALGRGKVVYSTDIGEVRRIALRDGSTLLLNTLSEVAVSFDDASREVRLSRGEALFEVARDPSRPFVVQVGGVTVRAIGTAFAVRMEDSQIDVTVTEGVVEVAGMPAAQGDATTRAGAKRVSANQRAIVVAGSAPDVGVVAPREVERGLAWRAGMVAFDGEPLAEAIAEVNRHNHKRIVVSDGALAAQPVIGIFRATDVEGFAATTAAALGARVESGSEVIQLLPGMNGSVEGP
jgi:transmembrane sensor